MPGPNKHCLEAGAIEVVHSRTDSWILTVDSAETVRLELERRTHNVCIEDIVKLGMIPLLPIFSLVAQSFRLIAVFTLP